MSKRYVITLVVLLQTIGLIAQTGSEFTIKGKFTTSYYDGLKVYLNDLDYKNTNAVLKKDSAVIEGDRFTLSGVLEKPIKLGYLTLEGNENLTAIVVLEKGTIELEMSEEPQMSGTVKNNELKEFSNRQIKNNKELQSILDKAQNLHKAGALDRLTSDNLERDFIAYQELMRRQVNEFVGKNILNELGEFFFTIYAHNIGALELSQLYASASREFQQSQQAKSLMKQYVWNVVDLRVGQIFKGVELKSQEGDVEDIATHFGKGKVVLVDFWASWCGPCIKTIPILVRLYERYKDSGFEIVGISLDESESSWKGAIKRLGMTWPQYIDDGSRWRGAAAQQYKIERIPQTYLLDKDGKIAGHDLDGSRLIEKIEELLTKE